MQILIGADIVPTDSNIDLFVSGDVKSLVGDELLSIIRQANFRIFNLETPLTNHKSPIKKCGDALLAPTQCIVGLKAMGIDLVTLSNNHIMDQDVQGLQNTIETLNKAKIAYVGAGFTKEEAAKPYFFCCDEKKIGIYACAEHEFSIVDDDMPGANPMDLLESFEHIKEAKDQCDYLIVLYHGGKEHYRYPSPNLQRICHKCIDEGADLVVCQHSHCIGLEEKYKQGIIIYGQGNFVFDGSESEYWQTSLLIQIVENFKVEYLVIKKDGIGIRMANEEEASKILSEFVTRSHEIDDPTVVKRKYNDFAYGYISDFLSVASGKKYSILTKGLNKLIGGNRLINYLSRKRYPLKKRLTLMNRIECEANRELFISGLKASIFKEKNDYVARKLEDQHKKTVK